MINSRPNVATSLETILIPRPTPSVLSAPLSNNKKVLVFYVLANNLLWHKKQPQIAYNIYRENSERAILHVKLNSVHVPNVHNECYRPFVVVIFAKASY